jgi:hypothetical protein
LLSCPAADVLQCLVLLRVLSGVSMVDLALVVEQVETMLTRPREIGMGTA